MVFHLPTDGLNQSGRQGTSVSGLFYVGEVNAEIAQWRRPRSMKRAGIRALVEMELSSMLVRRCLGSVMETYFSTDSSQLAMNFEDHDCQP